MMLLQVKSFSHFVSTFVWIITRNTYIFDKMINKWREEADNTVKCWTVFNYWE